MTTGIVDRISNLDNRGNQQMSLLEVLAVEQAKKSIVNN